VLGHDAFEVVRMGKRLTNATERHGLELREGHCIQYKGRTCVRHDDGLTKPDYLEDAVVDLTVSDGKLILHVRGADKLWAFKSSLEIPLEHVAGIRADPSVAHGWYHGIRLPGTNVPGVLTAGTFYQHGQRVFWDVHNPDNTIVIELHDERYNELIVEVADPVGTVALVSAALH